MKRIRGTITHWNRRKAYGFITPGNESKEVFVHISEFRDRREMPSLEDPVEFTLSADKQGRPCASDVARIEDLGGLTGGGQKWLWVAGFVVVIAIVGVLLLKFL